MKKSWTDWLDDYPPDEESAYKDEFSRQAHHRGSGGRKVSRMAPQAQIDLHGMTVEEALPAVERFLAESKSQGLKKVLIIHGKGCHSEGEPVLKKEVRLFLERSPLAGAMGTPKAAQGGSGAVWVVLKG